MLSSITVLLLMQEQQGHYGQNHFSGLRPAHYPQPHT
jgi:hypothetical protein